MDASSSNRGNDEEDGISLEASSDERLQGRKRERSADSPTRVTRHFLPTYDGGAEQNRTRSPASSGQLCWRSQQDNTGTGGASSSKAVQSTSFGSFAAGEENRTTMENALFPLEDPSSSLGNVVAAGQENRTEPATHTLGLPPSSSSFYILESTAIATDVATAAVNTAAAAVSTATAAASATTTVASAASSFNYHPPIIHPSFSNPDLAFQVELDLEVRNAYSLLVCSTYQPFTEIITRLSKDYITEMITKIVSVGYRNIFFQIAQTPRGSSNLVELIAQNFEVANMILPVVSLPSSFIHLMNHEHGRFVVDATLAAIRDQPNSESLYRLTQQFALNLARNPIGSHSLMNVICVAADEYKRRILSVILANTRALSRDHIGALVIQRLLDLGEDRVTRPIVHQLRGCFFALSCQKLGSHIVERILSSQWYWKVVANELLRSSDNGLPLLANDPYGCRIVQRLLYISSQSDLRWHEQIVAILAPWSHILQVGDHSGAIIRSIFDR